MMHQPQDMLDFISDLMDKGIWTSYFAKPLHTFAIYEVQRPYISNRIFHIDVRN